ncbi:lasso peptide biosynthesis PqqD family chaperone [Bacillus sp. NEB1478]|uniref:lasso peptide biosynthesis PqqD family chaperone n=1 Tax=Bacillus sp. NEB1478 TaxID=3073816 RepID=UPI002872BAD5|nr:lasso peptide biosynthesis PqqD family chaperone [Bacillus sp. NEB1478]WNB92449.1 lasso peptide biosynthesis PqqD family chaperone [Bacillus sp. NEB1478]
MKITSESLIRQVEGNIVSDMDGEKVMMSIKNGKYYNLGSMGGIIWDKIAKVNSITNLVEMLTDEYEIEKLNCQNQVVAFIEKLKEENLIMISNEKER